LYAKLWNGGVYYDVGSNCGQFVIPLAKVVGKFGRVIAFEPHPSNYERLARNIELNQLGNVRVFRVALGDRERETDLFGARGDGDGRALCG
jgi:FkbM family methyltransferase